MKLKTIYAAIAFALSSNTALACGDSDGDYVCDAIDNCILIANSDQADSNGDLVGDACSSPTAYIYPDDAENVARWAIWIGHNSRIKFVTSYSPIVVGDDAHIHGRSAEHANRVILGASASPNAYATYIQSGSRIYGGTVRSMNVGRNVKVLEGSLVDRK